MKTSGIELPIATPVRPQAQDRSRYILLNTLSSYARDIVDTLIFLVLIPFIISTLGTESFGLWSLIWAFLSFFDLADMGFGTSVVKYVADAKGRDDLALQQKIICTLFGVYVGLGLLLLAGVGVSLLFFNQAFDIPAHQQAAARAVLLILGVRSALYLPLGMFRGVLIGCQKQSVANGYKILANVLYFVGVWLALRRVPDIRVLAVLTMLMGILPFMAMMIHARRTVPGLSLHPRHFDRRIVREVSSFSFYFTLIQISGLIATRVDAIIIKAFLPLEMVAIYAIAMRLTEKANQFCSHLTKALTPVVAELRGAGEEQNIRAVWYRGSKLTVAFATPLLVGLAVLAEPLVRAWTGPGFELSVPALWWLVAATSVNIIHSNTANILSMGGQQKYLAVSLLGGQVLNFVLSVLLIRWLGITGVAMATFLASLPTQIGLIQTRASRLQGRSHWDFYRQTVLPSVLPALVIVVLFYVVQRVWPLTNLVEVAALEAAGCLVFAVVFWFIGFTAREQAYFKEKVIRRLLHRRQSRFSGQRSVFGDQ